MGRLVAATIIVLGEGLFVFAEMNAAYELSISKSSFWVIFFRNFAIIFIGGILVLLGYGLGIKYFQSIWIVVVVSIAGMLLIEPVIAFFLFRTLPETGAILGMIFSFAGCAYTFKK